MKRVNSIILLIVGFSIVVNLFNWIFEFFTVFEDNLFRWISAGIASLIVGLIIYLKKKK